MLCQEESRTFQIIFDWFFIFLGVTLLVFGIFFIFILHFSSYFWIFISQISILCSSFSFLNSINYWCLPSCFLHFLLWGLCQVETLRRLVLLSSISSTQIRPVKILSLGATMDRDIPSGTILNGWCFYVTGTQSLNGSKISYRACVCSLRLLAASHKRLFSFPVS